MSQQQQHNTKGQAAEDYNDSAFQYWLLFSLLVVLLPCTLWAYRKVVPRPLKKAIDCSCTGCDHKVKMKMQETKQANFNAVNYVKFAVIAILWIVFAAMLFSVVKNGIQEHEPYNPYAILGLATGAAEDEIKKAYRTLSRQFHPDKGGDENTFIAIAKAYEALTDPAIREKFEKYGNPDGPQPISVGIALPSWLVNRNNSSIVLSVYLIALVVLIPTGVYFWNKKSKQSAGTIHNNSLSLYYHVIDDKTRMAHLVEIIGASQEYKEALPERDSDKELLQALVKAIPEAHKIKKFRFNQPYIAKATILLHAHICRLHQQVPAKLEEDFQEVLKKVRMLLNGAFQICKEKRQLGSIIEILKLNQCLTQAAWDDQPLKQIPYLDSFNISSLNFRKVFDLAKFNRIGEEARKEYLQAQSISAEKIRDIENVLKKIPTEVGINVKLVSGEDDGTIYSTAVCTLEVEFVDKTPKKNKKVDEKTADAPQSEESKQIEQELTAKPKKQKGMASKKGQKAKEREERRQQLLQKEREALEKKEQKEKRRAEREVEREKRKKEAAEIGEEYEDDISDSESEDEGQDSASDSDSDSDWEAPAKKANKPSENFYHSPYVNEERAVCWWMVFGDRLKNELVALGKSESWEEGNTIKMQFLTPEKPGTYNYSLHLMCDGYIGLDSQYSINFKVVQNPNPIQLPPRPQHQQQPPTKKELKEQRKQKKLQ